MGLLGATVFGAGAYAAGSSAARRSAQEASQNQQLAQLEAQQQAQAYARQQAQAMPQHTAASSSLTDEEIEELRKLGEMKKEGLLTLEEFQAQKQRLLS